jgi:2-hydroxy fatty acid dioxygenase
MEPVAGILLAPLILGATAYSNVLLAKYGSSANSWALAVHVVSWVAQFIGHGVFEGRAPALLDNLLQAVFLAPFFVWFEILFFFGYRPELKARLDKSVQVEIMKFKAQKQVKANGETKKAN